MGSACELEVAEVVGRRALNENPSRGSFSQDILSLGILLASPGNNLLLLLCHAALGREVILVRSPRGKEAGQEVHSTRHLHSVGSGGPGL